MPNRLAGVIIAVGVALLFGFAPERAHADKRVALVIGNSKYQTVNPLPNPARDAAAIARMFKDAGFDSVETLLDVGNLEFKRGIRRFEDATSDADMAVIYYAGHGIEIGGTNYLIPIDARLASDRDAPDEAITLDRLVISADSAKKLRVIILDACRDNPFTATMRRDSLAAKRSISSGLTQVDPSTTDTLIAYAAKAGSTAEDGDGDHSPFTAALLKDLTVPGRDIRIAFGYVKDDVMKATNGRQEPFVYGSLGGGVYSLVSPPPQGQEPSTADAKADFELVKQINTRKAWDVYLNTYKTGFYADLARGIRDSLPPEVQVASLGPATIPASRPATTKEEADWSKIKDSADQTVLQNFISRYPDSPLAIIAQDKINALIKSAQERAEQERLAKEAADRKAAELAAAKQHEEDERKAQAAEAQQRAKAEEAARQAAAAKAKADQAAQLLAAAEAAKLREESERAEQAAEAERQKAAAAAAAEAACKQQADQLAALQAKGSMGSGVDDMAQFVNTLTCDRVKPLALAALNTFNAEAAKRTADLIRSAQTELTRIGCYTGAADGVMSDSTKSALSRYLSAKGLPGNDLTVTDTLVTTLQKQQPITCLRTCPNGQTLNGDKCTAAAKPAAVAPTTQAKRDSSGKSSSKQKQADTRPASPRATQQAAVQHTATGGYGSAGGHTPMVGVGF